MVTNQFILNGRISALNKTFEAGEICGAAENLILYWMITSVGIITVRKKRLFEVLVQFRNRFFRNNRRSHQKIVETET